MQIRIDNIQPSPKCLTWKGAAKQIEQWQQLGLDVVMTNGCFDIMHYGHLAYLEEARQQGDKLVVALNSADSIQGLKGAARPINDDLTRLKIMASLSFVDLVVVFDQDTPLELITLLKPDILVKGGDWTADQIVGSEVVLNHGGTVKSLKFVEGYSTTNIESKIIDNFKKGLIK